MQFTVASALRFFDDLFKVMGPKVDPHCKLNDAEIATIAIMAALSFYGNQAAACGYMQRHYGMNMAARAVINQALTGDYVDYKPSLLQCSEHWVRV